jgi:GT2 family glycosyltransferase
MRPQLSIVVPAYNNWWMTARALRELDRLSIAPVSFETIVVDNGSTDETQQEIARYGWVRYLRHERNLNFAGACNAGARAAEAPLTLFLNNDAYPLGDALTPLVRAFRREEVAIAGGALFFEDGVTQSAGLVLLRNAHWHYACRNLPHDLEDAAQSRDALAVSGAAMAARTEWFLGTGGFDESYVNGFEDVDLCMRAREEGRTIAYVADARFAHYEGASEGRFDLEPENERKFYAQWSSRFHGVPRVARGEVGAIAVHLSSTTRGWSLAALEDLEAALRSFGHPMVRGDVPVWQRLDKRFRQSASLAWFDAPVPNGPSVTLERSGHATTELHVRGAVDLMVPWLPCASPNRADSLPVQVSLDPRNDRVLRLRESEKLPYGEYACVVVDRITDDAAFGNVMLAHRGMPAVVVSGLGLEEMYESDVAMIVPRQGVDQAVRQFVTNVELRERYGKRIAADSLRRFNPRRTAIRVVDLLCAARFGLERPGPATSDSPI